MPLSGHQGEHMLLGLDHSVSLMRAATHRPPKALRAFQFCILLNAVTTQAACNTR